MNKQCVDCHLKTINQLTKKFADNRHPNIKENALEILNKNSNLENPALARVIFKYFKDTLEINDLYVAEKKHANDELLRNYSYWEKRVHESKNPIKTALKLAVIGNIIDFGAHTVPENLNYFIEEQINKPFAIDQSEYLADAIKEANSILYLGDNCGEIVFDKLLIETIQHPNVTFVVRGAPIINDATIADASSVGIQSLCNLIDNGYDAPSTILSESSKELNFLFKHADLIISKGQGNFEGLMNESRKGIYFLLMSKCEPISKLLGTKINSLIIKEHNQ